MVGKPQKEIIEQKKRNITLKKGKKKKQENLDEPPKPGLASKTHNS
jgi:hypothetical protein